MRASSEEAPSPQASLFVRYALALYSVFIVCESLYPLQGWMDKGVPLLAWVMAPPPAYLLPIDVDLNVMGYIPLGILLALALQPVIGRYRSIAIATIVGLLLSFSMETLQNWLPTRVPSNYDLAANGLGALLGAVCIQPFVGYLLHRERERPPWRTWFDPDARSLIVILLLWPFAQSLPQPWLFGTGDWVGPWLANMPLIKVFLNEYLPADWLSGYAALLDRRIEVDSWVLWEGWVTGTAWLAVGMAISVPMRSAAPRTRLIFGLLALTLSWKTFCFMVRNSAMTARPLSESYLHSTDWLTDGALWGLLLGSFALSLLIRLPRRLRFLIALGALSTMLILINVLPTGPFNDPDLIRWRDGYFKSFNGLAQWLSWIWPYLTMISLLSYAERKKHDRDRRKS